MAIIDRRKAIIAVFVAVLTGALIVFSIAYFRDIPVEKRVDKPYYPRLKFAISLLDQLQKDSPEKNVFYSPHSVYSTLLLAYLGAAGETEKELRELLGLDLIGSKVDVENAYELKKQQSNRFQNESAIEFLSVDKLYVSKTVKMRDSMRNALNESIERLNFADEPDQSRKHINQFIAENTKNHIKDLLQPTQIKSDTIVAIVNAAYFNGQWKSEFDRESTVPKKFYKHDGEAVNVDMMSRLGYFHYGYFQSLDTDVLKMPYKGDNESISMFILLPKSSPTAIDELLSKLTANILDDVFSCGNYGRIKVSLPKFSIEKTSDLKKAMMQMEVENLFNNADFRGIFESRENLNTDMLHKAKIAIDETGSTAAAATVLMVSLQSYQPRPPPSFECNHPFMFIIYDEKINDILFTGIFRGQN